MLSMVTQSYAVYGDVVDRCKFDVMNRTRLSHNAWNQMCYTLKYHRSVRTLREVYTEDR